MSGGFILLPYGIVIRKMILIFITNFIQVIMRLFQFSFRLTVIAIFLIAQSTSYSFSKPIPSAISNLNCDIDSILHRPVENFGHQESNRYNIPELDVQLSNSEIQNNTTAAPPPPSSEFVGLMRTLNKWETSEKLSDTKEIIDKALDKATYVDKLTGGNLEDFPIVKKQTVGQTEISIVFQSARIYPRYAQLDVRIKIELPQKDIDGNDVVLYFAASDIKFSKEDGLISGYVGLVTDYAIKLGDTEDAAVFLKRAEKVLIEENDPNNEFDNEYQYTGTYIAFDCDGFEEMGVGGDVFFSREWMLATDENGNVLTNPNHDSLNLPLVNGHFQVAIQDWNDFLLENISISHFVLTEHRDMSFYIGNANLDLSSYRNPLNIPYDHVVPQLWEGIYVEAIDITLPKPFQRTTNSYSTTQRNSQGEYPAPETERIKISARHLLIDEYGVFGEFSVSGQAPLLGGPIMDKEWGWSLDSIGMVLSASDIVAFGFKGDIGVPLLAKDRPLGYEGFLDFANDKYVFEVSDVLENKKFPIWNVGTVSIASADVAVEVENDEFVPRVEFNDVNFALGDLKDLKDDPKGSAAEIPGIGFSQIVLTTKAPYANFQGVSITGGQSQVMNLPVSIDDISHFHPSTNESGLEFTLSINLMDGGSTSISADGSLAVVGKYVRDINGARSWEYDRLVFNGAELIINLPQFYAKGCLNIFEEDPVYGKGFNAALKAEIIGEELSEPENKGKFRLDMMAIFGSTDGYRYFLVDGFIGGEAWRIPIPPTPLYFSGFGGGVFHHMAPVGYNSEVVGEVSAGDCTERAQSLSGLIYEPTQRTKLGLKFSTSIVSDADLLKGLLTCIIRFDQNYSLQNITFWGSVDIMLKSKKADLSLLPDEDIAANAEKATQTTTQNKAEAEQEMRQSADGIKGVIGLSLDFEEGFSFHGYVDASIKVGEVLTGNATIDLLVDPGENKWHYYLGGYYITENGPIIEVPDFFNKEEFIQLSPAGVMIDYGGFEVAVQLYFLTGNDIPGPPPPPDMVTEFFKLEAEEATQENRNKMSCNGNSPAKGTGMAFGASAVFDFSKVKKGFLGSCLGGYKVFVAGGVGFDIALLKFDETARCSNTGQSPMGINGFRAYGRLYAFVNLEGRNITCIPIPEFGLGIYIDFDVPNPSHFKAVVILKLGGMNARLPVNLGEECGIPISCN